MDADMPQGFFKGLYESVKPVVWIVKAPNSKVKRKKTVPVYLTAFAVNPSGRLMTTCHGWNCQENKVIKVRRLDETSNFVTARVVAFRASWDVCILDLDAPPSDITVGSFGAGELENGQVIMAVAHPYKAIGSFLLGRVLYPCISQTGFQSVDDVTTCKEFEYEGMDTPLHRIMGHICNKKFFEKGELAFVKELHARLPIVHSAGLVAGVGHGVSGAPIFNLDGDIIGMYTFGFDKLDVGIHVSVLRKFLAEY